VAKSAFAKVCKFYKGMVCQEWPGTSIISDRTRMLWIDLGACLQALWELSQQEISAEAIEKIIEPAQVLVMTATPMVQKQPAAISACARNVAKLQGKLETIAQKHRTSISADGFAMFSSDGTCSQDVLLALKTLKGQLGHCQELHRRVAAVCDMAREPNAYNVTGKMSLGDLSTLLSSSFDNLLLPDYAKCLRMVNRQLAHTHDDQELLDKALFVSLAKGDRDEAEGLLYQGADPCWKSTWCYLYVEQEELDAFNRVMAELDPKFSIVTEFLQGLSGVEAMPSNDLVVRLLRLVKRIQCILHQIKDFRQRLVASYSRYHGICASSTIAHLTVDVEALLERVILPAYRQCLGLQDTLSFCAMHQIRVPLHMILMQDKSERAALLDFKRLAGVSAAPLLDVSPHISPSKLLARVRILHPQFNRIKTDRSKQAQSASTQAYHPGNDATLSLAPPSIALAPSEAARQTAPDGALSRHSRSSLFEESRPALDKKTVNGSASMEDQKKRAMRAKECLLEIKRKWNSFAQSSVGEANKDPDLQDLLHTFGCEDRALATPEVTLEKRLAHERLAMALSGIEKAGQPFVQPRSTLQRPLEDESATVCMEWVETLYNVIDRYFPAFGISKEIYSRASLFDGSAQVVLVLLTDADMDAPEHEALRARFAELESQGASRKNV
jgi:hypothetical protein